MGANYKPKTRTIFNMTDVLPPPSTTPSRPPTSHPGQLVSQTSNPGALVASGSSSPKAHRPAPSRSSHPAVYHAASSTIPYGCEHTHTFARQGGAKAWHMLQEHYGKAISKIFGSDNNTVSQTYRTKPLQVGQGGNQEPNTTRPSVKPTWLCVQCPHVWSTESMKAHFRSPKIHSLFVESRSGFLFCANCDDFIYDPQLEQIRLQKASRKRKYEEMAKDGEGGTSHSHSYSSQDDHRMLSSSNIALTPCRAIGLRGLYNMGNTCFMSVVIQSLLHNPFLRAFYLSRGHRECQTEEAQATCTSCALDEIFTEFHSHEKTEGYGAVPMLIRSWKGSEQLAGYQQQDAHEYMQFILNSLHASNTAEGQIYSEPEKGQDCECIIHKTFYGKLRSTVTCEKCRNTTTALDPFMDLSLDVKSQAKQKKKQIMANGSADAKKEEDKKGPPLSSIQLSLQDCLASFTKEEKLSREDYTCSKCKEGCDATKQLRIKKLPPVMCIHLKVCFIGHLCPWLDGTH